MHERENENYRDKERETNDEGWVYPDRMPGQSPGTAYGYGVKRRPRQPINKSTPHRPRQPVNMTPGSMQRRGAQGAPQNGAQRDGTQGGSPQRPPQRVYTDPRYPPKDPSRAGQRPQRPGGVPQGAPRQGAPAVQRRPQQTNVRPQPQRAPEQTFISRALDFLRENKKAILIGAAIILAIILLILIVSKSKGSGKEEETSVVTDTRPVTDVITEPDPEPEPAPKYPYSERTADTKQFASGELSCRHAILIDVDEHKVVAELGGDEKIFPASMTKVLTVLTAVDRCSDLNDKFTMTNEIVNPLLEQNATSAGFFPGEQISIKDLMYGALLPSGADGTGGLAVYTSGSESAFAAAMNEKCAELGLKSSHFSNASGLHNDDHYSTCQEIAIIFEAAMDNPDIAAALGSAEYTTAPTEQHPEGIKLMHTLLYERLEGSEEFDDKIEVIGGKTGYTDEAGNCLVTMAKVLSTGKRYIFVCAGGDGKWAPVYDTIHVYRNYLGEHFDGEYVPKYLR